MKSGNALVLVLVMTLVGLLGGLFVGAVVAYVSPRLFESRVVLQVSPGMENLLRVGEESVSEVPAEQFFATEVEVIRAQVTLALVVEELDLTRRWNLPVGDCVEVLKKSLVAQQIRGTDLLEIKVRRTNAEDARDVAESVATKYQERRTEAERKRGEAALAVLDVDLAEQEQLVEEKRKTLQVLAEGIMATNVAAPRGGTEEALVEMEKTRELLEVQSRTLGELEGEDLFQHAAGLMLPQNGITGMYERYVTEERKRDELVEGGMGEAHPTMWPRRCGWT